MNRRIQATTFAALLAIGAIALPTVVATAAEPLAARITQQGVVLTSPPPGSGPPADWGPLAVLDDPTAADHLDGGIDAHLVRITDTCVTLRGKGGGESTLAWRTGDTTWDPVTQEVVFADSTHGLVRLSDGDRVNIGGYGGPLDGDIGGPPLVWLIRPDPSCPQVVMVVHEIAMLRDVPPVNPAAAGPDMVKKTNRACVRKHYADPRSHLREDIELGARQRRWTLRQGEVNYCSTEAVGHVAELVAAQDEDILVGSALSEDPVGVPSLYIKGVAPAWVHELIDAEAVPIELVDGQPFSFEELDERQTRVAEALVALGYGGVMTSSNVTGAGIIPTSVTKTPGLPSDPVEIKALLSASVADLVPFIVLTVSLSPNERLLPSATP